MSKAFTLASDATATDAVSRSVSSDLGASYTGALTTAGSAAAGSSVLTPGEGGAGSAILTPADGSTATGALTVNGGAAGSNALTSGDASDTDPLIADTSGVARDAAVIPGNPQHALGDEIDSGDGPQWFHTLTPGDETGSGVVVVDEAGGGAAMPGEAASGPTIQE
jgi:hypothetical protein